MLGQDGTVPGSLRCTATATAATGAEPDRHAHGYLSADEKSVLKAVNLLSALIDQLAKRHVPHLDPQAVVDLAVRTVWGAHCSNIVAWRDGRPVCLASSSKYPSELDAVRVATEQGPSYDALRCSSPVISDDIADDGRYPTFGPTVCQNWGIRSIASWRVHLPSSELGVLSCYSEWPYGFSQLDIAAGGIVADCCSLSACLTPEL